MTRQPPQRTSRCSSAAAKSRGRGRVTCPTGAVLFESGADRAVFLADALLDEFQLVHPDWVSAVGMLPEETVRTRTWLLNEAARDGSIVVAYHLADIGLVERSQGRYRIR